MMRASTIHKKWQALPIGALDDIIGHGTCLVLAPHPDDESLGCGGLIAACVAAGRPPLVAILTDGAASHHSAEYPPDRLSMVRRQEVAAAVAELGLNPDRLHHLGFSDSNAPVQGPAFERAVDQLLGLLETDTACGTVCGPWVHDPHCDHVATAQIACAVTTRSGRNLISYPVWGWTLAKETCVPTGDIAGWRFEVASFLQRKKRAIEAHRSQYGSLITDDMDGFSLPDNLLAACTQSFETFLRA